MKFLTSKEFLRRIFIVIAGSLIGAVGMSGFLAPVKLLASGVSGIGLLVSYLSPLTPGVVIFALNIPIFALALRLIDRDFALWSFIGMALLAGFLELTAPLARMRLVDDFYLNMIAGSVLSGFGTGLVFRARSSHGGTDIVAAIVRKYRSFSIGYALFAINGAIICAVGFFFTLQEALASLVAIFIEAVATDRTIVGIDTNRAITIITDKPDEIASALMEKLGRGATIFYGKGAYTGNEKEIIYCIITIRQLAYAKNIVESIDKDSFMTVHDITEVVGSGFRRIPF
ncbi:MAG: YitT family protein [Myxococcota bacterium]